MTGWRVGVIIAEPELLEVMNDINGSLIYTAPSISQRAAIHALSMRREIREKYVTAYRDRIFYTADRIEKIPYLSLVRPKGTFYLFPGIEKTGLTDDEFCNVLLLDKAHVLVATVKPSARQVPGTSELHAQWVLIHLKLHLTAWKSFRSELFSLFFA